MLGPDRFASFETPNVIDPGDAPPVQPKRKDQQQQQASGQATGASVTPPRSHRATGLGRTEKIALHSDNNNDGTYQERRHSPQRLLNTINDLDLEKADSYDNDDHDDDEEGNPRSFDDSRNYAATLLKDANRLDLGTEEPSNMPTYAVRPMYESASKHLVRNRVIHTVGKVGGVVVACVLVVLILARLAS